MKKIFLLLCVLILSIQFTACVRNETNKSEDLNQWEAPINETEQEIGNDVGVSNPEKLIDISIKIGDKTFLAKLYDNCRGHSLKNYHWI